MKQIFPSSIRRRQERQEMRPERTRRQERQDMRPSLPSRTRRRQLGEAGYETELT